MTSSQETDQAYSNKKTTATGARTGLQTWKIPFLNSRLWKIPFLNATTFQDAWDSFIKY